ncbi:MAG: hypothetical protein OEY59_09870 [Deltaproteobacteria bacterium]|nr:hypothetical protein [Deltaproteobacteria bacterium]
MKSFINVIVIALLACFIFSQPALAAKKKARRNSDSKLVFEGRSLYNEGDQMVGASYISGWGSGIGVRYSYFMFDDMHVQIDYAPLSYNYGWGTAEVNYISAAAIFHTNWWAYNIKNSKNNGYYFGIGFAQGKATYKNDCSAYSYYCYQYEMSHDFGGLYWVGGWEIKLKNNIRVQAGYGITGINLGGDYPF